MPRASQHVLRDVREVVKGFGVLPAGGVTRRGRITGEGRRMAYDEALAERVRQAFGKRRHLEARRMFGGIAFLLRGHMCCGVLGRDLVVRVGPERYDEALGRPHARRMDFTGRALKGMVYVGPDGTRRDAALKRWVDLGVEFVGSLPEKAGRPRPRV